MGSITALDLVNRVRTRLRVGQVGSIVDKNSFGIVEFLNDAISDVVTTKDWKFDLRHDGLLLTKGISEELRMGLDAGVERALILETDPVEIARLMDWTRGDCVTRMAIGRRNINTGHPYGERGFRMPWAVFSSAIQYLSMNTRWPGDTGTYFGNLFSCEYLLDESVRKVVNVYCEQEPVRIREIDPGATWYSLFGNRSFSVGPVEWVGYGGTDVASYEAPSVQSHGSPAARANRLIVYPIPEAEYCLRYSYYIKHPRLEEDTDSLYGVPEHVVDDIVRLAHAAAVSGFDRDVDGGMRLSDSAMEKSQEKYQSEHPMPAMRRTMGSFSSGAKYPSAPRSPLHSERMDS